jgi:hypothetical protein
MPADTVAARPYQQLQRLPAEEAAAMEGTIGYSKKQ